MIRGIAVIGLNGAGKSSIAHILAKTLGYAEMDVEDYYFPEQKESRQKALEGVYVPPNYLGTLPFSVSRTKEEVQCMLLHDLSPNTGFILSGVTMNWSEEILSKIDLAFWVQAPLEIRLHRIRAREEKRFGSMALPGGAMYEQQQQFREVVADRDPKTVEQSISKLHCPVHMLDGTLPVKENVDLISRYVHHE
ncbi:MAG: hypothetical protein HDR15_04785 [Lachnospiraceae bacterium]|nr:hypothetical protein [Lachnospiraceae bacterium]